MVKCPSCSEEIDEGAKFCEYCGNSIKNNGNLILCPSCGSSNEKNNKFCLKCGTRLNDIICPYCNSKLDVGVLKCKYCGEWVNQPINNNIGINNSFGGDPKLFTIIAYILTLINFIITFVMLFTPYIMLFGILLINLIWTVISIIFAFYVLNKYSDRSVKFIFSGSVKKHMAVVLTLNILFLLPQIFALFWNPFN